VLTRGTITKGIAGFYYVKTIGGLYMCRARGIFKKDGVTPLVGDEVMIEIQDEDEGVVSEILPRRNAFVRPPIANIDVFISVVAAKDPVVNPEVLDRFLVTAEVAGVDAVVCINKADLREERSERGDAPTDTEAIYASLYPTVLVSAKTGEGIERLKSLMRDRRAAFAGPSGVGKSSLINRFLVGDDLPTGTVSEKTRRGRHTTRHVEIFNTDFNAEIYDTPGYTSFEGWTSNGAGCGEDMKLDAYFPDIGGYGEACRFDNCRHVHEPGCAVTQAAKDGAIAATRYASYVKMLLEMERKLKKGSGKKSG
jgi:ribosome biogenesis GTPase